LATNPPIDLNFRIFQATRHGNIEELKYLLEYHVDITLFLISSADFHHMGKRKIRHRKSKRTLTKNQKKNP
jgi:hypothetical protein